MPRKKLLSLIEQLEAELEVTESLDTELVEKITRDLNKLKQWQPESDAHDSDFLLEAATHFEEEHPKAASIINDIAYMLTNIGI